MKFKEVNIGSLGQVVTGNTPLTSDKEFYGGTYQFIKPTDMDIDRRRVTKWEENYTEKAFKKYKNSFIPKGSTGVVTIGTVGEKMFQADRDCFTNQSVNVVIPNDEYDQDFIYYLLKFNLPKVSNANPGTASGRHHVSKSNFCAINVVVPTEKFVQIKIGQILSAYDDLIENNLKRIQLLEELAQRTYEEWFVKFRINGEQLEVGENGLPDNFIEDKFDKHFKIHNGYAFKSEDYQTNGVKILRTRDYSQTKWIEISQPICISKELADKYTKYQVQPYDLMLIMVGASIGNYGIVLPKDIGVLQNQNQWAIRSKDSKLNFYKILMMENLIRKLLSKKTGAARDFFRAAFLNEMNVVIPNEHTIIQFNKIIEPTYLQINTLFRQNEILKEARDILLPRLMIGKINVEKVEEELEPKIISLPTEKTKEASKEFKEAVLISVLTEKFGNEKFPLGRKRYTKLSYLFHRHADNQIQDYLRKAAGPYNPKTRYQGPEKIAHQNGYVVDHKSGNISGFIAGAKIDVAKKYFQNYWSIDYLNWLESQFKYKSNDELELYATVDSTMIELYKNNLSVTVENVKEIIKKEPEWKAKLERDIFNDVNIGRAIVFLPTLFNYTI